MKTSIYTRTLTACKLTLRRWVIRQVIKIIDRAEERLQEWQVRLRNDLSRTRVPQVVSQYVPTSVRSPHTTPVAPSEGDSSPSAEKRERCEASAIKSNTARVADDAGGSAQFDQQAARSAGAAARDAQGMAENRHHQTFAKWEARRSGVAVITKREARRRRLSAHDFDLRSAQ